MAKKRIIPKKTKPVRKVVVVVKPKSKKKK